MKKKNNGLAMAAGILFVLCAIINIMRAYTTYQKESFYFDQFLRSQQLWISVFILITAVGTLSGRSYVVGAGFAMYAALITPSAFNSYGWLPALLSGILPAIGLYCACIASSSDSFSFLYCISGATSILSFVNYMTGYFSGKTGMLNILITNLFSGQFSKVVTSLYYISLVIFGIALFLLFAASRKSGTPAPANIGETGQSQIERLTQIKTLLDQGIISQEDFEKKKQDILNR